MYIDIKGTTIVPDLFTRLINERNQTDGERPSNDFLYKLMVDEIMGSLQTYNHPLCLYKH